MFTKDDVYWFANTKVELGLPGVLPKRGSTGELKLCRGRSKRWLRYFAATGSKLGATVELSNLKPLFSAEWFKYIATPRARKVRSIFVRVLLYEKNCLKSWRLVPGRKFGLGGFDL